MAQKIGFLLLPRFSMLSLMSALEPLTTAIVGVPFQYVADESVASVTPVNGPAGGGTVVAVTGDRPIQRRCCR
ncbi:MAG: hypothetical protein ACPIA3_01945, partial [Pseudomonadales bacterium]